MARRGREAAMARRGREAGTGSSHGKAGTGSSHGHGVRTYPSSQIDPHRIEVPLSSTIMALKLPFLLLPLLLLLLLLESVVSDDNDFIFNGFQGANLSREGAAEITAGGLLELTNTTRQLRGHAFYPAPIRFKPSRTGSPFSFSCVFVFGIVYNDTQINNNSIAFVVSPSNKLISSGGGGGGNRTLKNSTDNLVAVDVATGDIPYAVGVDDNTIGIDADSVKSVNTTAAGYYAGSNGFTNLTLSSGDTMQVWVEYDSRDMRFNVTLSPSRVEKPGTPLMSSTVNLSEIIKDEMYVGFSSSTGLRLASHYILGWSFRMNGQARPLNITALPSLPSPPPSTVPLSPSQPSQPLPPPVRSKPNKDLALWTSVGGALLVVLVVTASAVLIRMRKTKSAAAAQEEERWEMDYGPHRFTYRELYAATGGFKEKGLLGSGGFGRVYKGVLPSSNVEVAVKRVSPGSKQGMKEFIAEIVSIGRLRHRNLVQLLGYCRRKKELILVYSYMPNGSLDKLLFARGGPGLSWYQRFQIVKGVASGLLYLHEEWEQVIIHRDIKAGNVLLDSDFNGRLGDFGLARLSDHGNDPQTTHVAGTMGYMAPELTRSGRATKATDVFAFGVFLLEVACGRRPIERRASEGEIVLLDWALSNWKRDAIGECADPKLMGEYPPEEMELVLKLGLLCSHQLPAARPTIRQVMQYMLGDFPLPDVTASYMDMTLLDMPNEEMSSHTMSSPTCFSTDSLVFGGR